MIKVRTAHNTILRSILRIHKFHINANYTASAWLVYNNVISFSALLKKKSIYSFQTRLSSFLHNILKYIAKINFLSNSKI